MLYPVAVNGTINKSESLSTPRSQTMVDVGVFPVVSIHILRGVENHSFKDTGLLHVGLRNIISNRHDRSKVTF